MSRRAGVGRARAEMEFRQRKHSRERARESRPRSPRHCRAGDAIAALGLRTPPRRNGNAGGSILRREAELTECVAAAEFGGPGRTTGLAPAVTRCGA